MNTYLIVCVVAATILSVQGLTEEQKEKIKNYHKECLAVSGVDAESITKARQGNFPDDAKFKEHIFCFSKKAGFQNEAGEIQKDVLRAKLLGELQNEEVVDKLVAKCAVQKDTPQNTAVEAVKCYYVNSEKRISLV